MLDFHARKGLGAVLLIALAWLVHLPTASAQSNDVINELHKLVAANASAGTEFGKSIALDGNTALIGARNAAYVFVQRGDTWRQQARFTASDDAAFGTSVALDGDTALIGAYLDDENGNSSGAVYVYARGRGGVWQQQAKLTANDAQQIDHFGFAVAVEGNTALIGAFGDDVDNLFDSGSAYVFTRSGGDWEQQTKLVPSDADSYDQFGFSVAFHGTTALIGARYADVGGEIFGSVYVFRRSEAWSEEAKLFASDAGSGDIFGNAVAIDKNTALIGASGNDDNGNLSGSAYVFTRRGGDWNESAKLTASDAATGDRFGDSVALDIDANFALVGAGHNGGGDLSGKAYVFKREDDAWGERATLVASDAGRDWVGVPVALRNDLALIGARLDADNGSAVSGSVYVFDVDG